MPKTCSFVVPYSKVSQNIDSNFTGYQNVYVVGEFPNFFLPIDFVSGKCYQMSSFSEGKAEDLIENSAKDFVMYNARQLSRIYPSGKRTGSSNYKPTPLWNVGCQMGVLSEHVNKSLTLLLSWSECMTALSWNCKKWVC
jgi:hypothetical protein